MGLVVQKYGGSSVKSTERIEAVADHICSTISHGNKVVVTVSAMGASTDELLALAHQITDKPPGREVDMLLTAGERITMALLSIALHKRGLKAKSLTGSQCGILTDEVHGNARIKTILGDRIRSSLDEGEVVIVAGFQGVSPATKEVTTLGRGGTDLSAIALSVVLEANRCEIYKDVDGVYSADPNVVQSARRLESVSWRTMSELTWAGAAILHSRSVHLAQKYRLPFYIRSSYDFDKPGSLICKETSVEASTVTAITKKENIVYAQCSDRAISLGEMTSCLWDQGESPLVSQMDGDGWKFLVSEKGFAHLSSQFGAEKFTKKNGEAWTGLTVVGHGFQQAPEMLELIMANAPGNHFLDVRNHAVTLVVDSCTADQVLATLHRVLIEETTG